MIQLRLIAFFVLITVITCDPGSHGRGYYQNRRGSRGGGGGHHHGLNSMDWDTTKTCADDFANSNGDCASFRKCCENLCEPQGGGYRAECTVTNGDEARLRCACNGGGGGGAAVSSSGGDGDEGAQAWRPPRPRPTHGLPATDSATFAPLRPAGGDKGCGVPTVQPTARIVGGTEAKPHSWPWQISLQYRGRHLCGGSLIGPNHILTAAHCFGLNKRTSSYKVVVGMHDRSKTDGTVFDVSKIHVHPDYDEDANSNDAAVAVLSRSVSFSDNIIPICLPQKDVAEGSSCQATGWGSTEGTGNNRYLNQVRVPIIARSTCNARSHYAGMIDETMICAGSPGKDSCQGDSGGPLVCQRSDGVWELQGITSWGSDCAKMNKPGVYTRVVAVKDWVNQIVKN